MTTTTTDRVDQHDCALRNMVPAPIWLEDWSEVEQYCKEQRTAGVTDLRSLLENDEALLRAVVSRIRVTAVNTLAAQFIGVSEQDVLLGGLPGGILNEGALASLVEQIDAVWRRETTLRLDINGIHMGGADLECQLDWAASTVNGSPDYSEVVVLVRDIKEHREEERQIHKNVEKLETLLDMSRGIASTFDIETIIELLAEATAELVEAEQCWIFLFDTNAEEITAQATHGTVPGQSPEPTYDQIMRRLPGWTVNTRQAVLSSDVAADERNAAIPLLDNVYAGWRAAVAPILVDDLVLGAIAAMRRPDRPEFKDADLSLVKMLAGQAAVAIQNAGFYEELRNSRDIVQSAHEELKHTQTQLLSAQKMEAIGGLAAGIAHEINTPIQYVSDNVSFIKDSAAALSRLSRANAEMLERLTDHPEFGNQIQLLRQQWKDEDCDFFLEELPDAIEEIQEGATRVADIVKAMKEFAHPGHEDLTPTDINRVIKTTVQVSRNEWKYVADIEFDLDETLPMIPALAGPLGQSLLIMIVNSAQAMVGHHDNGKGTIKISSSNVGGYAEVRVSDNGPGIPEDILGRIFEPFFTTKEIGKGSGQGLSIAHSVIVDKHKGSLWADNTYPGAVFIMHIPMTAKTKAPDA